MERCGLVIESAIVNLEVACSLTGLRFFSESSHILQIPDFNSVTFKVADHIVHHNIPLYRPTKIIETDELYLISSAPSLNGSFIFFKQTNTN